MSNHLNFYGQKGCVGCKSCEKGGAHIGLIIVIWIIAVCTAGIGLVYLSFCKKWQYCTQNTRWNKHHGPDLHQTVQTTAVVVNGGWFGGGGW
jgi:hypothetical protein